MAMIKDESVQIMEIRPFNCPYSASLWKNIIVHKGETKNLRHKDKNEDIAVNIWNIDGVIDAEWQKYTSNLSNSLAEQYMLEIETVKENDSEIAAFFTDFVDT